MHVYGAKINKLDDPEDPLNWTPKRKLIQVSCVVIYTLMIIFPSTAVYSVTTPISKATDLTINNLTQGTGAMFLSYGWGCIIWQALALQYGQRPAYIISLGASVVIMAVTPMCTTVGSYTGVKILQGLLVHPLRVFAK
jgi:MFS family permease